MEGLAKFIRHIPDYPKPGILFKVDNYAIIRYPYK